MQKGRPNRFRLKTAPEGLTFPPCRGGVRQMSSVFSTSHVDR